MSNAIDAASNPDLANRMIQDVMNSIDVEEPRQETEIIPPPDTELTLPGGYFSPLTGLVKDAEVRELTGRDEEQMAKARNMGTLLGTILSRGVVRIGESKPDKDVLDGLLAGDREFLLLRIFSATFGDEINSEIVCSNCGKTVPLALKISSDVPVRTLEEASDRVFEVDCQVGPVKVELPTGYTQKELYAASGKSWAELSTILLANTVTDINGHRVLNPQQILDLPIRDRRKIAEEISKRNPGPLFGEIKKSCPECQEEMEVPLNLASLFQL